MAEIPRGISAGAAMGRRGFTLIEVLAVVAIALVVMAISLPAVEDRLGGARFEAAAQRVDSGLAWARAEAQRRGEALRVEARRTAAGYGLFLVPLAEEDATKEAGAARPEQPFAELDSGVEVTDRKPEPVADGRQPVPELRDRSAPLSVAVFLPDGSAMGTGAVYLVGLGQAASLAVNHWTGGTTVSPIELTAKAKEEGAEVKTEKSTVPEGKR